MEFCKDGNDVGVLQRAFDDTIECCKRAIIRVLWSLKKVGAWGQAMARKRWRSFS